MLTPDKILIALVAGVIGGAAGAHLAKSEAWKGAVAAFVGVLVFGIIVSLAISANTVWIAAIAGIVAIGAAGGAMKMNGAQITNVGLGSILFASIVAAIV